LPVEAPAEADVRAALPQRDREPAGDLGQDAADRRPSMDVLVGVQVGRVAADQAAEGGQLAGHLVGDGPVVVLMGSPDRE